jgi:hypothetical protein
VLLPPLATLPPVTLPPLTGPGSAGDPERAPVPDAAFAAAMDASSAEMSPPPCT